MSLGDVLSFAPAERAADDERRRRTRLLSLENSLFTKIAEGDPELAGRLYHEDCKKSLRSAIMFKELDEAHLDILAAVAVRRRYKRGELIVTQGTPHRWCYVIASGEVRRSKREGDRVVGVDMHEFQNSIGTLCVLGQQRALATVHCTTDAVAYALPHEAVLQCVLETPTLALQIADSLCTRIAGSTRAVTPLFAPRRDEVPLVATAAASAVDAVCRSVLASQLNATLTGRHVSLLPGLYFQVPSRVVYISSVKLMRARLDEAYPRQQSWWERLAVAVAPGLAVTPLSSWLEARNAAAANPEPMLQRCRRGSVPRACREVVFAIGLCQASGYFEERLGLGSRVFDAAAGGAIAGVFAAWLSHLPHSLSTMKLARPTVAYSVHWSRLRQQAEERLPAELPPHLRRRIASFTAAALPQSLAFRAIQTAISFAIINGGTAAARNIFKL